MACVITKGGNVISIGINKISPGVLKDKRYKNKGIHAELDAILSCDKDDLKNATVYIVGYTKGNGYLLTKPCELCYNVLTEVGIKHIYYHDKENEVYKLES